MQFDFSKIANIFSLSSLTKEDEGSVGIDIGSSAIKVVQIKRVDGVATLETYGELALGPYANVEIGRATNLDPSRLAEALVDIIREASVTSTKAALSISYASSFVTILSLPPTVQESQLASMVPIEARKYVPVPINEVSLDWFIIPDQRGAGAADTAQKPMRVLLAAIHNEALEKYKTVMQKAGLQTRFNEIEAFSSIRSSALDSDGLVTVLDIGASSTKLYVVSRGMIERVHSMTLGSQDMTLALSSALELSVVEAEEIKRQVGIIEAENDPRIKQSLIFTLERIMYEAKRVIAAYESGAGVQVSKVVCTGGGALLKGLPEYAATYLEREVVIANPFSKVAYPAFLEDTLREAGPSFAVALGVALRNLNE